MAQAQAVIRKEAKKYSQSSIDALDRSFTECDWKDVDPDVKNIIRQATNQARVDSIPVELSTVRRAIIHAREIVACIEAPEGLIVYAFWGHASVSSRKSHRFWVRLDATGTLITT